MRIIAYLNPLPVTWAYPAVSREVDLNAPPNIREEKRKPKPMHLSYLFFFDRMGLKVIGGGSGVRGSKGAHTHTLF